MRYVRSHVASFEELGLLDQVKTIAESPRGIVLVTGTTGSGGYNTTVGSNNNSSSAPSGSNLGMNSGAMSTGTTAGSTGTAGAVGGGGAGADGAGGAGGGAGGTGGGH